LTASRVRKPEDAASAVTRALDTSTDGLLRPLLEAAIERDAEARFEVDGASMLPLIRSSDVVHVRATGACCLHSGEVVALSADLESGLLVHRVVACRGGKLLVRGDNCSREDGLYAEEAVIGVVTRVERNGKSVWFGSGHLGGLVAWAVRHGLVWRFNWVYYALRRRAARCLKFHRADSRLREQKGDDAPAA
jgi:hypothetical protein